MPLLRILLCIHCAYFSDTWYMGGQETECAVEQNEPLQIVFQKPDGSGTRQMVGKWGRVALSNCIWLPLFWFLVLFWFFLQIGCEWLSTPS